MQWKIGYMYILLCSDDTFYTGSTIDLLRRLEQHQNGEGANHTRKRLPVKLVYFEKFNRIDDAFKREKQVQNWSQSKKIALIQGKHQDLHFLSICQNITNYKFKKERESKNLSAEEELELLKKLHEYQ